VTARWHAGPSSGREPDISPSTYPPGHLLPRTIPPVDVSPALFCRQNIPVCSQMSCGQEWAGKTSARGPNCPGRGRCPGWKYVPGDILQPFRERSDVFCVIQSDSQCPSSVAPSRRQHFTITRDRLGGLVPAWRRQRLLA